MEKDLKACAGKKQWFQFLDKNQNPIGISIYCYFNQAWKKAEILSVKRNQEIMFDHLM